MCHGRELPSEKHGLGGHNYCSMTTILATGQSGASTRGRTAESGERFLALHMAKNTALDALTAADYTGTYRCSKFPESLAGNRFPCE